MSDIRIREMSKDHVKKLDEIQRFLKLKVDPRSKGKNQTPKVILAMIDRFAEDQKTITALQKRNSELHKAINEYYSKDGTMKGYADNFISNMHNLERYIKSTVTAATKTSELFNSRKPKKR
jgi:hypothetical protein